MRVLITTVPESTSERDVRSFVLKAICSRFQRLLRRKNRIESITIIELADQQGRALEYQAIVEFERTDIALMAIKKLNGTHLNGVPVIVRRYFTRSSYRDRRRQRSEVPVLAIHDRRKGGRRRLEIKQNTVSMARKPDNDDSVPRAYTMEAAQLPLY
ncbi:MAG: RNA-binding protein [Gammaproteobacteria bacterium]|nr:RNA-binding protein [Gammaproteobacteria bacterium]